jgi:CHAD domain-containing protein
MRKLIKRFERLGVTRELAHLAESGTWRRTSIWLARTGAWRTQLRHLVAERAADASEAIVHATGVYFPNRAHAARIDLKKFRYAAEIAVATGLLADAERLRTLKKSQDLLGDLHDRQTLIDELRDIAEDDSSIDATQLALVRHVLEAEIAELHTRFLARRTEVRATCDGIGSDLQSPNLVVRGAAIAAVALASGLEARRRLRSRHSDNDESESLAIRVAVPLRDASLK